VTNVISPTLPARRTLASRLAGLLTIAIALSVMGALYAAMAPGTKAAGAVYSPTQIAAGHDLFLRGCASCHGLNAQGSRQAPSLIGVGPAAVDFQVSTGRMPLASFYAQADRKPPRYSPDQIADLAAYIYSVGGDTPGPLVPNVTAQDLAATNLAQGGALFRYNCAQCHGASAGGGAISGGGYAPDLAQADPKTIVEAMLTGPEQMPKFSQLPATTKFAIVNYVQNITHKGVDAGGHPIGKIGPVPEGLVAWTVGIGACVVFTLWIGARR
jgi:ubiquinol-cytochrome c reductase cytochrome c subunit